MEVLIFNPQKVKRPFMKTIPYICIMFKDHFNPETRERTIRGQKVGDVFIPILIAEMQTGLDFKKARNVNAIIRHIEKSINYN